jgi:hypothetical protein
MRTEDDLRAAFVALERHAPDAAGVLPGARRRRRARRSRLTWRLLTAAATAAAGEELSPEPRGEHTGPAIRLDPSPGSHRPARRTRLGWFGPLAAAAVVVLVVAGGVAAGSWFAGSGNGQSGNPGVLKQGASAGSSAAVPADGNPGVLKQGASAGVLDGVPAYYVEVPNQSSAVVRATATGAMLARITTHTPFVGVTGAADDRTFVLDAQRSIMGPTVLWPGQPAFYLLRLSASGAEESFARLALPALPGNTVVTGLALSPDGSKLAVEADSRNQPPGLLEIMVYTLATGAFRTWSANGLADSESPNGFTGSGVDGSESISWAADGKTLAFDWVDRAHESGVRLLDTAASGDNLTADSRVAVTEMDPQTRQFSACVTDSIISLDGSAIVCGYYTGNTGGAGTTTGFIRYSASTGKMTDVRGVYEFGGQAPAGDNPGGYLSISLYWVNSTGNSLIESVLTPGGNRVAVINGEKFTLLPGTAPGAAAW